MPPKRRKSRRKAAKTLEERFSVLLEKLLVSIAAFLGAAIRRVGAGVRAFARALAQTRTSSKALVIALTGTLVLGYLHCSHTLVEAERVDVWVDSEVEALARVIRSEAGGSPVVHRVHVAWATLNLAAERNQTVAQMACSPCGRQQRGRPVSSRMKARDVDRVLAKHILEQPEIVDPTGGATHFINPVVQDRLAKSGAVPGYKGRTYKSVRKRWIEKYGWEPYYRLGPDLELWGKKRVRR